MVKQKYDNLMDYYYVCESTTDPMSINDKGSGLQVIEDISENGVKFLRFYTTVQTFRTRTRNGRQWNNQMVKQATNAAIVQENLKHGGLPGECGHPCPDNGDVTIERIVTIVPDRVSHAFKRFDWLDNDLRLAAVVDTVDDGNGLGDKLRRNILQGLPIAFSNRSVIPQRKNRDGSSDQTGVGRFITADRVYNPGCADAYKDESVQLSSIIKDAKNVQSAMESCVNYIMESSPNTQFILDGLYPDLSTASVNKNGDLVVSTESTVENEKTTLVIPQGIEIRSNIRSFMKSL